MPQAPHRIADALLRDNVDSNGTPFRLTAAGRRVFDARVTNATGMFKHCPTAIIFGVWDSTGPRGGLGCKFQRCMVSEIVGINAVPDCASRRIDPAGIEHKAGSSTNQTTPTTGRPTLTKLSTRVHLSLSTAREGWR
ncbi:MAG: type I-U CRISPR-associated protein Cas7 [Planctomycetota bacterium]